ncbi:MAG: CorA family divalent cation transporter, partial [Cyclobacteriaceae bacterium]
MITIFKEKKGSDYEWIDLTSPTKEELSEVSTKYDLHKALVEDSLQPEHLPKFEMVGDTQFIILRVFNSIAAKEADTIQEVTNKIAVFIKNEFIITIHRRDYDFLHDIRSRFVE